jgi:hypothetical protein
MKLNELLNQSLLEGKRLAVYESLIPIFMLEDGEGGDGGGVPTVGDSTGTSAGDITGEPIDAPTLPPNTPSSNGGWGHGPFNPGGVGMGAGHWFNEFYRTLKNLVVISQVSKRMKELGIGKEGTKRVRQAVKQAAKNVNTLLTNPRATAYRIPQWTFDKPKTPMIKRWNEGFAYELKQELSKLNEQQILN